MSTEVTTDRPAESPLVPARRPAPILISPAGPTPPSTEGINLAPILHSARRRWQISLLLGLALCGLVTGAAWTQQQPEFAASSHLRISASNPRLVFDTAEGTSTFEIEKSTQQQLMLAPFVLSNALGDEEVANLAVVQEEPNPIGWLQENLSVTFPGEGEIMVVALKLDDPVAAVKIVNAVVTSYLNDIVDEEKLERANRLKSLESAYAEAYDKVRLKRSQLKRFADTLGMSDSETMSKAQQNMVQYMAFWMNAFSQAEWDLMQAESELELIKSVLEAQQGSPSPQDDPGEEPSTSPEAGGVGTEVASLPTTATVSDEELELLLGSDVKASDLQRTIDRLEERIAEFTRRLVPKAAAQRSRSDRAELAELEEQLRMRKEAIRTLALEQKQQQLASRLPLAPSSRLLPDGLDLQKELEAKQERVAILKRDLAAYAAKVEQLEEDRKQLGGSSLDIEMMRSELADAEDVRRTVGGEIERTNIELNSSPRVELLSKATTASASDNRKRIAITGAAGACGLFAPLFLMTLYDFRKRHVNDARSVIESLDTLHLGSIPRVPPRLLKRRRSADSSRYQQWQERLLESVDAIASLLIRNAKRDANRVIQIASPAAGEGKSTVATQLARSLARSGHRTLLVDFDLRRPTLHSAFGFDLQPGVAEVLDQSAALEKTILRTTQPNMDLLTAGCRQEKIFAGSSAGLLESLFKTLREDYEFVIVDSCPILPVVDARVVGQHVDGVIFSLLKDFSKLPQAVKASEIIKSYGIRIIGTVVTGCQEDDQYYAESRKYLT